MFFTILQIQQASDNIANSVARWGGDLGLTQTATSIIGGILLLIVGYFVAKFVSGIVTKSLKKTGIDNKSEKMTLSSFAGKLVYYLLMIIVLMAALTLMGVNGLVLKPLNDMTSKFFMAIPNIIAAGIIAYVGYFLAKIVSELIEASGDKIRSWLPKLSTENSIDIVKVIKTLAFIFIFIPILIIALEKLNFRAITEPATGMLATFINAIPNLIYAVVILLVAVIGGKFIVGLLKELLNTLKLNELAQKIKIQQFLGSTSLVSFITNLVYVFIIYLGIMEACNYLGLVEIKEILDNVLNIAGKVAFGLVILILGNVVADFAANIFMKKPDANKFVASIIRVAIIFIFLAIGLRTMGIADSIIELAFGLSLGAVAIAFALSFGLGGREAAGEQMKKFFDKFNK